jgi:capsular polysaccharide transport system ATP-binding protein
MIQAENISKEFNLKNGVNVVLQDVNLSILKGEKIGIIGNNGSGKSTLIRILAGIIPPDQGTVKKQMTVSWPVGYVGGFQNNITGIDNIKFISKIYGADYKKVLNFVKNFSDLDEFLDEPLHIYSSGMKARLNFSLMMGIDFDCYLIDELLNVGDADFRLKCNNEIFKKRHNKAIIIASHNDQIIKRYCTKAYVIFNNTLCPFNNTEDALKFYRGTLKNNEIDLNPRQKKIREAKILSQFGVKE